MHSFISVKTLSKSILQIKSCTKIGIEKSYTYFQRNLGREIFLKPFNGVPTTGSKPLTIGLNNKLFLLKKAIEESVIFTTY